MTSRTFLRGFDDGYKAATGEVVEVGLVVDDVDWRTGHEAGWSVAGSSVPVHRWNGSYHPPGDGVDMGCSTCKGLDLIALVTQR